MIIACELILVAALAYVLAQIFWTVMSGRGAAMDVGAAPAAFASGGQNIAAGQADILTQIDVFYRQAAPGSAAATGRLDADLPAAPETALDLQLFGVRAGADSEQGSAIIRSPDGKQRSFMVGEDLIDGVRLLHVLPDRVVIAHRGVRESLAFADAKRKRAVTPAAAPAVTAAVDPASLFQQIETRPRRIDGKLNGFLLYPKGDGATFRRLGLEAGDVLLAVNDRPLGSFEALQEMPQRLAGLRRLRLTIERQGQNQTLNIGGDG
ncbi:MAG: GspC family type II secretion system variant ExeC [Sphingomonadales bacterium]